MISTIYSGHLSDYISLKGWWVQGNKKVTERLSSLALFFLRSTEIILSLILVIYSSTFYCGSCVWLHKKPISHLFFSPRLLIIVVVVVVETNVSCQVQSVISFFYGDQVALL